MNESTIVAIATPPGRGAVGIIRVSGPHTQTIAEQLTGKKLTPRLATLCTLHDEKGEQLDQVLALLFCGPASYTGEDTLELHAHGNPILLDKIVATIAGHGAILARPGQFTERAFLNGKLDLAQAEAVADLIDAASHQATSSALRSLQGKFSDFIHTLVESLIRLRVFVEATLDFPEEDVDFIHAEKVAQQLAAIREQCAKILREAQTGVLLRDGFQLTLIGEPNAGKSSLLNQLTGQNTAIVTSTAGTTRDIISEMISIAGIPVRLSDTAGLRQAEDEIEQEGIRRAQGAMISADKILLVVDGVTYPRTATVRDVWPQGTALPDNIENVILVRNKIDLCDEVPSVDKNAPNYVVSLSALSGAGLDGLIELIKETIGFNEHQSSMTARRRHVTALNSAMQSIYFAETQCEKGCDLELIAEELRQAQKYLSEITGTYTSDDLLGEIFSSFCIGK